LSAHREHWYLDRLRAELERVAAEEDRREQRRAPAWLPRFAPRPLLTALAVALIVALVVAAGAMLVSQSDEQIARPAPTPVPNETPTPQAYLQRLNGTYIAEITPETIARIRIKLPPAPGVWRLTIDAAGLDFVLDAPEGSGGGAGSVDITGAGRSTLALAPDRNCEVKAQRGDPLTVRYAVTGQLLRFSHASGGCGWFWTLLQSTTWRKI
jgi:hypothetical protein